MQLDHSDIQTGPRQPARETGHAIMRLPYQIRVATQAGAGRAPMAYTRSHHVWHGPHTQRGGTFLGILLGLMLGAGAAAGIAWYIYQSPLPFITPSTPDKGKVVQSAPEVPSPVPSVAAPQGSTLPDPNQGSSRQQVMPQPDPRNVVQSQGVSTVDVAAGDDAAALDAAAPVVPAICSGRACCTGWFSAAGGLVPPPGRCRPPQGQSCPARTGGPGGVGRRWGADGVPGTHWPLWFARSGQPDSSRAGGRWHRGRRRAHALNGAPIHGYVWLTNGAARVRMT